MKAGSQETPVAVNESPGARVLPVPVRAWVSGSSSQEAIAWAAAIVLRGGLVVFPTETFYGLGGHPGIPNSLRRIYDIKGRSTDKPLPLIAADQRAAERMAGHWPEVAERLARAFWPGPLTLLLPASPCVPAALHGRTGKIALRVSSHEAARSLAAAAGGVITATSANPSGTPPCTHPDQLPRSFLSHVDGVLDGGFTLGGLPSTLLDVTRGTPRILREGAVARALLANYLT